MELLYTILGETKLKFDLSIGYDRHLHLNIKIIVVSEADDFGAVALYGPRVELKKTFIGRKDPVSQVKTFIFSAFHNIFKFPKGDERKFVWIFMKNMCKSFEA